MKCERCDGKGIVLNQDQPQWSPKPWNGSERRLGSREDANDSKFREVPAQLYVTCDNCDGAGKTYPGLLLNPR